MLGPDLQEGVAASLSDLPAQIVWVTSLDAVPKDEKSGVVQGGGIVITFGNIQVQADGSVSLPASAFISGMIGGGQTYILERANGEWQVTGNTGAKWIS